MELSIFHLLRLLAFFALAGPLLAEVVGYLWHRGAEHNGLLGDTVRYRHYIHHEVDYPVYDLRPTDFTGYKSKGVWSWYVAAAAVILLIFLALPLGDALATAIGGTLYGKFVVDAFHTTFHIHDHWLNRFKWYRILLRRHDIHHWAVGNYGIVFFFMDRLFGTLRDEFPAVREKIFPNFTPK